MKTFWYMFLANMDEADRTEESAEDMTAALTAPSPRKATHCRGSGALTTHSLFIINVNIQENNATLCNTLLFLEEIIIKQ